MPTIPQLGPTVVAVLWEYFARMRVEKLRIGGSFDQLNENRTYSIFYKYTKSVGNL